MRSPVPRAAKEIKRDPSLPLLQKVGPPVPESHKNWGPCFTSPKIAWSCYFRPVPPVTEKPKMSNLSRRKGALIENDVAHKLNQLCRPLREADAATSSK